MAQKIKTTGIVILSALGLYAVTRNQYKIPDFSVFIPNRKFFFSGNEKMDKKKIVRKIFHYMDMDFTTRPHLGFNISVKPIHGINIPIQTWVPWDFPIIIPQVMNQMEQNIKIEKKKVGTIFLGYNVEVKNVTFYA